MQNLVLIEYLRLLWFLITQEMRHGIAKDPQIFIVGPAPRCQGIAVKAGSIRKFARLSGTIV